MGKRRKVMKSFWQFCKNITETIKLTVGNEFVVIIKK